MRKIAKFLYVPQIKLLKITNVISMMDIGEHLFIELGIQVARLSKKNGGKKNLYMFGNIILAGTGNPQ